MLARHSYPTAYVAASRAQLLGHLDVYESLHLSGAQRSDFEPGYLAHLLLALDHYFADRGRGQEGKDGNPLNEVRLLCTAVRDEGGVLTPDDTVKYDAARSVLGVEPGQLVVLDLAGFRELAVAFFDEIEKRFPET